MVAAPPNNNAVHMKNVNDRPIASGCTAEANT